MSNSLRILHLCSARHFIGEAARVVDLCSYLKDLGHEVHIVARAGYSVETEAAKAGIPVTGVHLNSRFGLSDIADIKAVRKLVREFKPDLLHCHRGKDHWLAAAALFGQRNKIPLVRTRHVITPIKTHLANRWLFGKATSGVIYASEAVADEAEKSGIITGPTGIITGGISEKRFPIATEEDIRRLRERAGIMPESKVVGCLARLAPVKGQEYILRAAPEILQKFPDTIFAFAYPRKSGYYEILLKLADELGVSGATVFLPEVENIPAFLSMCDVGILSSIGSEGWSRAAVEFMYFARPVVASKVGCLAEIVMPGQNGFLVNPRSSEELSRYIRECLGDDESRAQMGRKGQELVKEKFTMAATSRKVEKFYRQILERVQ